MNEFLSHWPDSHRANLQEVDVCIIYPLNRSIEIMVVADLRKSPDSGTRIDSFPKQELLSLESRRRIETQLPSDDNDLLDEINCLLKETVRERLARQRPGVSPSPLETILFTVVDPPYLFAENVQEIISMLDPTRIEPQSWQLTQGALREADRIKKIQGNNLG